LRRKPCFHCEGRGYTDEPTTLEEFGLTLGQKVSISYPGGGTCRDAMVVGEPIVETMHGGAGDFDAVVIPVKDETGRQRNANPYMMSAVWLHQMASNAEPSGPSL
jgi:hypothetical protein